MISSEAQLLGRFVAAFKRGLDREVAAMRGSAGTFELALARGELLGGLRYGFELLEESERLAAGGEYTLRTSRGEQRVTLERCDDLRIVVISEQPIDLTADRVTLVVSPWFLYERLLQALDEIDVERHAVGLAPALFGRRPHRWGPSALRGDHGALNASQRAAVQLCSDSDLAFIWGPPGIGKTVTLTHVIEELLAQGKRILLASTTNAAIDQVLAKLAARPWTTTSSSSRTSDSSRPRSLHRGRRRRRGRAPPCPRHRLRACHRGASKARGRLSALTTPRREQRDCKPGASDGEAVYTYSNGARHTPR